MSIISHSVGTLGKSMGILADADSVFFSSEMIFIIAAVIWVAILLIIVITSIVKAVKKKKNNDPSNNYNHYNYNNHRGHRGHIDPFESFNNPNAQNSEPFSEFNNNSPRTDGYNQNYGDNNGDLYSIPSHNETAATTTNESTLPVSNPNKCPHCGADTEGGKFCPYCGKKLK